MDEIIRVKNLRHVYKSSSGENVALDGVNLTIDDGEFVAIIGTNGSGKSTLAKHFNALLLPTSGKIFIDGLDTSDEKNLWRVRENVGMVFQNPDSEIVAAIVEDDVAFGLENLGIAPEKIRSEQIKRRAETKNRYRWRYRYANKNYRVRRANRYA